MRNRRAQLAKDSAPAATISPEYLSRMIGETVGDDAVIFNEYPLRPDHCAREKPGTFFALGPAGGLGWGFGAALGAKLAAPDKLVVATLGDGAYMFANPTVAHWVSAVHKLPILTIVFNNSRYGAVRRATLSMFKDGVAGENDGRVLADLDPAPPYDEMAQAQGAYGERVEKPADLPARSARPRRRGRGEAAGAAQRHYALLSGETANKNLSHGEPVHAHRRLYPFHSEQILQQDRGQRPSRHRQAHARSALHPRSRRAQAAWSTSSRTTRRSSPTRCRRSRSWPRATHGRGIRQAHQ